MKKLILSSLIALGMMAFTVNAVASEDGASEPTMKCGEGKCGGDKKDEATEKCGTGKCGGGK